MAYLPCCFGALGLLEAAINECELLHGVTTPKTVSFDYLFYYVPSLYISPSAGHIPIILLSPDLPNLCEVRAEVHLTTTSTTATTTTATSTMSQASCRRSTRNTKTPGHLANFELADPGDNVFADPLADAGEEEEAVETVVSEMPSIPTEERDDSCSTTDEETNNSVETVIHEMESLSL